MCLLTHISQSASALISDYGLNYITPTTVYDFCLCVTLTTMTNREVQFQDVVLLSSTVHLRQLFVPKLSTDLNEIRIDNS